VLCRGAVRIVLEVAGVKMLLKQWIKQFVE
jgi:hypothetical protein